MKSFSYAAANRIEDATDADGTTIMHIAGGTELLNWMRLGISAPDVVVDVGRIPGLNRIERQGNQIIIGGLATLNAVGENALVQRHARVLSEACLKAAAPQVRNRATLAGNVLQKTRCEYFRSEAPLPWPCNKRNPGSGCAARRGVNHRHAIFGWTDACVATQPSDPAVALACLDAEVEVQGRNGRRHIPMTSFHVTPQEAAELRRDEARYETQLAPDELIIAYHLSVREGERSAYVKVRERESYEYALVSAAAAIHLDGQTIRAARIALGSVAQKPWRPIETERALVGGRFTKEKLASAVEAGMRDARALAHNSYKIAMAKNAAVRALLLAGGAT
jgi:xanthine dehydrogenase YagS FAD-binding subunit